MRMLYSKFIFILDHGKSCHKRNNKKREIHDILHFIVFKSGSTPILSMLTVFIIRSTLGGKDAKKLGSRFVLCNEHLLLSEIHTLNYQCDRSQEVKTLGNK